MHVLTLKEEGCLVGNQVTGEILRRVHQAGDDCAAQIGTLEEVEKRGVTTQLGFDLDGSLHHGKGLVRFLFRLGTEALDGLEGLVLAAVTDEPPGRLGAEEDENQERGLYGIKWTS